MNTLSIWPPPYKIKKHRLAKSVKLKASPSYGLEIVTPSRFNLKNIPAILEEHKIWITQQLSKFKPSSKELPHEIIFHALNEVWKIEYLPCQSKLELFARPDFKIILTGKVENPLACKGKLVLWIIQYANKSLTTHLNQLSQHTKLFFSTCTIRNQKSRWGSCSSNQSINLNYKLIFLPYLLMRHVIIHELCHTQHFNHSPAFWNEIAKYDKNWRVHKKELRQADQFIPGWIL